MTFKKRPNCENCEVFLKTRTSPKRALYCETARAVGACPKDKWFESFEKELREKAYVYCDTCQEGKSYLESIENDNLCPDCDGPVSEPLIELKEILGDG